MEANERERESPVTSKNISQNYIGGKLQIYTEK